MSTPSSPQAVSKQEAFEWFTPQVDDSAPSSWSEFVALHMRHRTPGISPKEQLKAIAARWRQRDASKKTKGQQKVNRILPASSRDMFSTPTKALPEVKKRKKTVVIVTPDEDSDTDLESEPVVKKTKSSQQLKDFSNSMLSRKRTDGSSVTKFTVPVNKKTQRLLSKCLKEACDDISRGTLTPRDALLRGATIPFDFLSR